MDKASDFESEDCGFESRRGHFCDFIVCCWILCRVVYLLLDGCTETPQELQQVLHEHCADRKCPRLHVQRRRNKSHKKAKQTGLNKHWEKFGELRRQTTNG